MTELAPPAWRWRIFATLPSTQDLACESGRVGEAGHLAVLAQAQTAGRGSRGRCWQAPAGNLNFSALLRPTPAPPQPGFWALLAGIALFEAVSTFLPSPAGVSLKWPNDLLLDSAKLGGILIDSALDDRGHLAWVVIGLGVNILHAPTIEGRATASLAHLPTPPDPTTLAERITKSIDHWGALTLPDLSAAWLARAHPIGTQLTVQTGARLIQGNFAGLAPDGALLLEGHPTPISSGEIFLPAAHRVNA